MNNNLKIALDLLLHIQSLSGLNAKKDALYCYVDFDTIQHILHFVYNPYIKTGIGKSKLNKIKSTQCFNIDKTIDIETMFDYIKYNHTGRDVDIIMIKNFIDYQPEQYQKILCDIFTKTLSLGVSTTTFNKIWPGLIPTFSVQLACKWCDNLDYLEGKYIAVTEKLDGNRCFTHVYNGECTCYSRSGKQITNLIEIEPELSSLPNGWYDGELLGCNFNDTQTKTLSKGDKTGLVFNIFDYVPNVEVEHQCGVMPYYERRELLENIFTGLDNNFRHIKYVPLIYQGVFHKDQIIEMLDEYTSRGSEGLMINIWDKPYCFGRTCDLLKVKKMYNLDLRVVDITEGSGLNSGKVGALIVDYKGYRVGVGSGLNNAQRLDWFLYPEEIIGKIIEIKCFEETKDKSGNLSLRFPVFVRTRFDKNEESYN